MRKPLLIALFIVLAGLIAAQPVLAVACSGMWFESQRTGHLTLVNFTVDLQCQWGRTEDKNALQRSGECGMQKQKNDLIVLTHNWQCGWYDCPTGFIDPQESNIPLMKPGEKVQLCDGGTLWDGRVVKAITEARKLAVNPQDNFTCAGEKCGTIVTSFGKRDWSWGPVNYAVIRISYTRAR